MEFFVGLHQPADAQHFTRCMISLNRLVTRNPDGTIARTKAGVLKVRRSPIPCPAVFLDSGAFTTVERYGGYPDPPSVFVEAVMLIAQHTPIVAVSTQDLYVRTAYSPENRRDGC